MRVIDIENINFAMHNETQFVLRCEEVFHDKIQTAVATVLPTRQTRPFIMLAGPSGSGKTTTAMRLQDYLENLGIPVCLLSMDNFFFAREDRPAAAAADQESPLSVNIDLLVSCMERLAAGETVDIPVFNFRAGRPLKTKKIRGAKDAFIIVEGLHSLNPLILDKVKGKSVGVYVAPRTRIITAEDKIIKPEQLRVARRLIRDYNTRGHSPRDTVMAAENVNRGEINYIMPFKSNASIHIDTFHDYEPCILSKYLQEIPRFREELDPTFVEEHNLTDLMKFVNEVAPLRTGYVPRNSIVREFVGGSCYHY